MTRDEYKMIREPEDTKDRDVVEREAYVGEQLTQILRSLKAIEASMDRMTEHARVMRHIIVRVFGE